MSFGIRTRRRASILVFRLGLGHLGAYGWGFGAAAVVGFSGVVAAGWATAVVDVRL